MGRDVNMVVWKLMSEEDNHSIKLCNKASSRVLEEIKTQFSNISKLNRELYLE
jgi:hypothetical protein